MTEPLGLTGFDVYRDLDARKMMIAYVMQQRAMDPDRAVRELRALNHVGLAHVYRDALGAAGRGNQVDYDPFEATR